LSVRHRAIRVVVMTAPKTTENGRIRAGRNVTFPRVIQLFRARKAMFVADRRIDRETLGVIRSTLHNQRGGNSVRLKKKKKKASRKLVNNVEDVKISENCGAPSPPRKSSTGYNACVRVTLSLCHRRTTVIVTETRVLCGEECNQPRPIRSRRRVRTVSFAPRDKAHCCARE
jgi:hypothetical protein